MITHMLLLLLQSKEENDEEKDKENKDETKDDKTEKPDTEEKVGNSDHTVYVQTDRVHVHHMKFLRLFTFKIKFYL